MTRQILFDEIFLPERDGRVAVLFEHRELSYADLRALTLDAAEKLNSLNVRPGDRVGILLNDSPEFIAGFVAIISLGTIAVPINMALRKQEQLFILKDCSARAAIIEAPAANALLGNLDDSTGITDLKDLLVVCRET